MRVKKILLTGDDSYNGIGLRILIAILKDKYDLKIAATLNQQSGAGGGITFQNEHRWGETSVDGIDAVWVDGTPADVMEFAQGYYKEPFDLIISGINYGLNTAYALISSGTFSAAIRGVGVRLAPKAIIASMSSPINDWQNGHLQKDNIAQFLEYPGNAAKDIIDLCIKNDNWNKTFVNLNFPANPTKEYKITKVDPDITKCYKYPVDIDVERKTFEYPKDVVADEKDKQKDISMDAGALNNGYISISPFEFCN